MGPLIPAIVSTVIQTLLSAPSDLPPLESVSRPIPVEAAKAEMQPPADGRVQLDGKIFTLSPGAQVRDQSNRIVMPVAVQQPATVRYLTDAAGSVHRIWILSPAEAAQRAPR
jgi:hypothetical protein